jgi:hypothetical protein
LHIIILDGPGPESKELWVQKQLILLPFVNHPFRPQFNVKAHSAEAFEQCKVSGQIASDRSEEGGVVMVNDRLQGAEVEAQKCSKERKELLACSGP